MQLGGKGLGLSKASMDPPHFYIQFAARKLLMRLYLCLCEFRILILSFSQSPTVGRRVKKAPQF